jgi:hypothetical protein
MSTPTDPERWILDYWWNASFRETANNFARRLGIKNSKELIYLMLRNTCWVLFGRYGGQPCIWEMKVKMHRSGFLWLNKDYFETGVRWRPKYLKKGTPRSCYLPGDIILWRKLEWRYVALHAKVPDRQVSSRVKLLRYILNEGEPKEYDYGLMILEIRPDGRGAGLVTVQPVVKVGKYPQPVGNVQTMDHYKLRGHYHHQYVWDPDLIKIVTFGRYIAEYSAGSLKKLTWKVVKSVVKDKMEKEIKQTLRRRIAHALPMAVAHCSIAALAYLKGRPDAAEKFLGQKVFTENEMVTAMEMGIVAMISTLLAKGIDKSVESALPKEVVEGAGRRLARYMLQKHASIFLAFFKGLIEVNISNGNMDEHARSWARSSFFTSLIDDIIETITSYIL